MLKTRIVCLFSCLMVAFSLNGCFSPQKYSTNIPIDDIEPHYGDLAISGEQLDRWWEHYGDQALNDFVKTVLEESLTLQTAYLRLLDSEFQHKQSKAGYYPSLSFSAGAGVGGQAPAGDPAVNQNYNLGLSLSYEIDLWGKVRAQALVSELNMQSAQDSAESAAMTLVGNVVTEWFAIQYYRERINLTKQLLELSESYYSLVEEYYRTGQSNGMDVLEQRQQIESLRATLMELETNIRISQHALQILAGGKIKPSVEGALPEAIHVGGTPDVEKLLEMRPDVRTARRNAQKANAQVVIALADRLPTLRLNASLALRSPSIVDLFKTLIWDTTLGFAANLFDGFNKTTAIDRAKVTFLTERLTYLTTVYQAVAEVEKALLTLRLREQQLIDAQSQLNRQNEILDVSRQYFIEGALDYNRVLSALRGVINSSQSELDARRNLLNAQIALFKAMGGSAWTAETTEAATQKAREMLESLDNEEDEDEDSKTDNAENDSK